MKTIFDGKCTRCGSFCDSFTCSNCGMTHSIELLMLNSDFDKIASHLNYYKKVSLEKCPYDVQEAVTLKRKGEYAAAQKIYIDLYKKNGILYADMALWWYKVLVSAGSISRALALLSFTLPPLRASFSLYPPEQELHFYELLFRIEGVGGASLEEYLVSVSGNPNYKFDKDQIDVTYKSGRYIHLVKDLIEHDTELSRLIFKMCTNYEKDVPW